jgi:zinc-binding alcohol dehydrogenase family protein
MAVVSTAPGDVDAPMSFVDVELEVPDLGPRDLLVHVKAVSVNPVDTKVRASFKIEDAPKVLGFDAAGIVLFVGEHVKHFSEGDEVFYAGSVGRSGSNTQYHLVDERLVGHKPRNLDFAEAAAMALTSITAWEALFEKFEMTVDTTGTLLIMGGAGGVGSMTTQMARQLTEIEIIATASRPESIQWSKEMGAHHVIGHRELRKDVLAIAPHGVCGILSPYSAGNAENYAAVMKFGGHVVAIDDPADLDIRALKPKNQGWQWEYMFGKSLYLKEDESQHEILDHVAQLVEDDVLKSTLTKRLSPLNADTIREAHRAVESSSMIGKIAVSAE